MSPRAFAVFLPTALAAWLASFMGGCSGENPAGATAATALPAPAIRYVTHAYRPATDFKRISEYFTGEEDPGGDVIVRTDTSDRRGLYFAVGFDYLDELPDGAIAVLDYVSSEKTEPQRCLFMIPPVAKPALFKELRLGITGLDMPEGKKVAISAWKLSLHRIKPGMKERARLGVKLGVTRTSASVTRTLAELGERLSGATGAEITSARSFLWSLPKKP